MEGIQDFVGLLNLKAGDNKFTSINLTNSTNLNELNLYTNPNLNSITFPSSSENLKKINLQSCNLESIDISSISNLEELKINNNTSLSSLDLSMNTKLKLLWIYGTAIRTIDLSQIWFICSMNEKPIDKALADRIFYIEIDGYSFQDKKQIIQNYLLPNALKNIGLNENDIFFHPSSIESLIHKISDDEKGIRQLKQAIQTIISKVAFLFQNQESIPVSFSLPKENYPISYPFQIKPSMISLFLSDFKPKNNHLLNLYI